EIALASQRQLPSSRPNGQQPIETSHLAPEGCFCFPSDLDKFQRFVTRACPQPDPKNKEKKPSAPDKFPPHHPHPDPTLRPQRDLGLQLNRLPGNKLHPPPLRDRCQRQHCFHPRKRLPNTLPPHSAKGKIRKAR